MKSAQHSLPPLEAELSAVALGKELQAIKEYFSLIAPHLKAKSIGLWIVKWVDQEAISEVRWELGKISYRQDSFNIDGYRPAFEEYKKSPLIFLDKNTHHASVKSYLDLNGLDFFADVYHEFENGVVGLVRCGFTEGSNELTEENKKKLFFIAQTILFLRMREFHRERMWFLEKKYLERIQHLERKIDNNSIMHTKIIEHEKNVAINNMFVSMAHEFKNPLNIMLNSGKAIKSMIHNEIRPLIKNFLQQMDEKDRNYYEGTFLLFNSLLMASIDAAERTNKILSTTITNCHNDFSAKNNLLVNLMMSAMSLSFVYGSYTNLKVEKKFQFPDEDLFISCHDMDMIHVFMEILKNSLNALQLKAQIDKNFRPELSVQASVQSSGVVQILMRDNGVGIPTSVLSKVFDPFFSIKPSKKGGGLGLPSVFQIVKKYGGEIRIDSMDGLYTEVAIMIPLAKVQSTKKAA